MNHFLPILINIYILSVFYVVNGKCPCKDETLCRPQNNPKKTEVFVFSVNKDNWPLYDWSRITTIVQVGYQNSEMLCHAHSKGVRIVAIANFQPTLALVNKTARTVWVKDTVKNIQDNYLDGVNVDFESHIYPNETEFKEGLTALMQELSIALKTVNKNYQISFDYPFDLMEERSFDYGSIGKACDVVYIMSYDMYWDEESRTAHANNNMTLLKHGIAAYKKLGVPLQKMVLGVPWYGYDYPCVKYSDGICYLKNVPFRGVKCSDAAGSQVGYSDIIDKLLPTSTTGLLWDDVAKSPYFTYKNNVTNQFHQVWFDNPKSLKLKYTYANNIGLRGVGMWEADDLDYSNTEKAKKQREEMWSIL